MRTRFGLQRRSNTSSDFLSAKVRNHSFNTPDFEQTPSQTYDFSHVDLFSHAPQRGSAQVETRGRSQNQSSPEANSSSPITDGATSVTTGTIQRVITQDLKTSKELTDSFKAAKALGRFKPWRKGKPNADLQGVFNHLDSYHAYLSGDEIVASEVAFIEVQIEQLQLRLQTISQAASHYVRKHPNGKKTPAIQELVQLAMDKLKKLAEVENNPSLYFGERWRTVLTQSVGADLPSSENLEQQVGEAPAEPDNKANEIDEAQVESTESTILGYSEDGEAEKPPIDQPPPSVVEPTESTMLGYSEDAEAEKPQAIAQQPPSVKPPHVEQFEKVKSVLTNQFSEEDVNKAIKNLKQPIAFDEYSKYKDFDFKDKSLAGVGRQGNKGLHTTKLSDDELAKLASLSKYSHLKQLKDQYQGEIGTQETEGVFGGGGLFNTKYLKSAGRDRFELKVESGQIAAKNKKAMFKDFDTSGMKSHWGTEEIKAADPEFQATQNLSDEADDLIRSGVAMYVMDPNGTFYAAPQIGGRFQHSSFLAGGPIAGAGEMTVSDGKLKRISNSSGHYMPDILNMVQVLQELASRGVDLYEVKLNLKFEGMDKEGVPTTGLPLDNAGYFFHDLTKDGAITDLDQLKALVKQQHQVEQQQHQEEKQRRAKAAQVTQEQMNAIEDEIEKLGGDQKLISLGLTGYGGTVLLETDFGGMFSVSSEDKLELLRGKIRFEDLKKKYK